MHIELLRVLRDGTFGPVRLGDTRSTLTREFGQPTGIAGAILWYGTFEFHFEHDALWLVHCDDPHRPWSCGGLLTIDPWVIMFGKPLDEVATACRTAGLPFGHAVKPEMGQVQLRFESGGTLGFDTEGRDAPGEPPLCYLSLSRR